MLKKSRYYSRFVVLAKEPIELQSLILRAWDRVQTPLANLESSLHLVWHNCRVKTCEVDPLLIEQVFGDLFENSLAACPSPTRINVALTNVVASGNNATQVSFQDNGPGFSDEQRQRTYDPFFTTNKVETGLGLTISKRIIDAHQGQLELMPCSTGALVRITIPW